MMRWWVVIVWLLAAGPAGADVPSAYDYAAPNLLQTLTLPNGAYQINGYDGLGRLPATKLRNSTNALLDLHAYELDPAHFYYHADGGGNVTALLDARQAVMARYAYDPFGNLLGLSGPMAEANPYRFSSKEFHANSGTYYYGFRFYEPGLQRWLSRDPLGEAGGLNLYEFVGNDPLNAVDWWGLDEGDSDGFPDLGDCPRAATGREADFGTGVKTFNTCVKETVKGLARQADMAVVGSVAGKAAGAAGKAACKSGNKVLAKLLSFFRKGKTCAAKTPVRVLTEAEKNLYGRVSHPKGFRQEVWERAKAPDGNVYDPTGRILKFDEPWQLGHRPAHKLSDAQMRAAQEGWDRQTWIRYQNDADIYRPELPSSNAGHRWE